ncbi:MAG: hypothetical protein IT361_09845 [Gemmatimonadaceae bacterium]|nr:hypothetical protein [Gemmatimonadaceae bacterium]
MALLAGWADAQQADAPSQPVPRLAGQLALGAALTPVGFVASGWATKHGARRLGWTEDHATRAAWIAAYTGTWLGAASGPILVGRDGRATAALGGSLVGLGTAALTVRVGNWLWDDDRRSCGLGCWTIGAVTIALPSIGATVAYAASRR